MNVAYLKQTETSFFSDAKEQLETLINQLESDDYENVDHGCVERYINEQGNELLRRLFQGWLDKKSANEVQKSSITNANGELLSHVRKKTKRTLTTLFGAVKVGRIGYGKSKSKSVFPADAELNLPQDQYSDGVRKRAAKEVIKSSFDNAVESIKDTTGGSLPKRQCLNVTRNVAQDFESYYEQNRFEMPEESKGILALSFDGKGIVMRYDSLRECTKKSAAKNKKLNTRLSPGEKKDRKRMAQVAAVYTAQPHVRTAESIMKVHEDDKVLPFKSPIRNKRVWASVGREAESVIKEAFLEALQRDPLKQRKWVVLIDGLPHQITLIKKVMKELDVSTTIVMDFIHVLEYLWKAAWCIYDKDDKSVEVWVAKQAVKILNGECSQVAKGIRQTATKRGIINRENIDKWCLYGKRV